MRPGSLTRAPALSSRPARGKSVSLRQRLLDVGDDALAGGDAGLDRVLDAAGRRSRPAWSRRCCGGWTSRSTAFVSRSKRRSPRRIRRSARVRALRVSVWPRRSRRRRVTPRRARERLGDVGGDAGDAVTRLQDGADVDQAGALGDVAALLGRRLGGGGVGLGGLARLVLRGGARATTGGLRRRLGGRRARGAARGRAELRLRVAAAFLAAALRFAADVLVVVVPVVVAM